MERSWDLGLFCKLSNEIIQLVILETLDISDTSYPHTPLIVEIHNVRNLIQSNDNRLVKEEYVIVSVTVTLLH